jgi:hypothetical protein
METAKKEVEALLRRLPEDASLEDIQYHLYVLEKVRKGIDSADAQPTLTQDEAEERLRKWLIE